MAIRARATPSSRAVRLPACSSLNSTRPACCPAPHDDHRLGVWGFRHEEGSEPTEVVPRAGCP
eukprot:8357346-Heterocapsa_arctica.AAC.1